jgi:hypothetical protein
MFIQPRRAMIYKPLIIEYAYTRDLKVDLKDGSWASVATPPPGGHWIIFDSLSSDRRTTWRRIHLVDGGGE